MRDTLCKQKDEGKREKLTNPMAYFDHSLLNMLPPSLPRGSTLLLIAAEWFSQSTGAPGDEQIPILT